MSNCVEHSSYEMAEVRSTSLSGCVYMVSTRHTVLGKLGSSRRVLVNFGVARTDPNGKQVVKFRDEMYTRAD